MIGHTGDPLNRCSLATFRRGPIQSSRVADEGPSFKGDVANPTLCLVGQKTRLIHLSPMTIYLTSQTVVTLITKNFIYIIQTAETISKEQMTTQKRWCQNSEAVKLEHSLCYKPKNKSAL